MPAGQAVQDAEPAVANVPTAHAAHPAALKPGSLGEPKYPAAQREHEVELKAPLDGVVVPEGQAEHDDDALADAK